MIKKITRVTESEQGLIEVVELNPGNYILHHVREAFKRGDLVRKSAGPGWGSHNALLKPNPNHPGDEYLADIYAPWWGTYLATIE